LLIVVALRSELPFGGIVCATCFDRHEQPVVADEGVDHEHGGHEEQRVADQLLTPLSGLKTHHTPTRSRQSLDVWRIGWQHLAHGASIVVTGF